MEGYVELADVGSRVGVTSTHAYIIYITYNNDFCCILNYSIGNERNLLAFSFSH